MEKPDRQTPLVSLADSQPLSDLNTADEVVGDLERPGSGAKNAEISDLLTRRLITAARRGSFFWVQNLQQRGADPYRQSNGITAIQAAACAGHHAVLRRLSTNLDTLLLEVARTDRVETATLLLDQGADIYYADAMKQTALFLAAAEGDKLMVDLLLRRGADRRHEDRQGRTPSAMARELRRYDIAKMIDKFRLVQPRRRASTGRRRILRRIASCLDLEASASDDADLSSASKHPQRDSVAHEFSLLDVP